LSKNAPNRACKIGGTLKRFEGACKSNPPTLVSTDLRQKYKGACKPVNATRQREIGGALLLRHRNSPEFHRNRLKLARISSEARAKEHCQLLLRHRPSKRQGRLTVELAGAREDRRRQRRRGPHQRRLWAPSASEHWLCTPPSTDSVRCRARALSAADHRAANRQLRPPPSAGSVRAEHGAACLPS